MKTGGWDTIVVGGGTAGAVVAARLSEEPGRRVLLLEAGGRGRDPMIAVPMMGGVLFRGTRHTWRDETEPVPGFGGRRSSWPRGKVLGGSSAINGTVYVRGLPSDYDRWAQSGLVGWSWEALYPLFLRSEAFQGPGGLPDVHGRGGPLAVSRPARPVSRLSEAFVAAGIAAGYPASADFNGPDPEGFGYFHFARRNGRRETTATAFLGPARRRPNLDIRTGAHVLRIVVEGGRAAAVEIAHRGRPLRLDAGGAIVLSAGTIGSPQLLMLSGIGPPDELRRHGIAVVAAAPEVGRNLQDHVLARVQHLAGDDPAARAATLFPLARADRAAWAFARAYLAGRGPMTVFPLEAGAYLRSVGADLPDLQSHFLPALTTAAVRLNPLAAGAANDRPGFMANVVVMRPQSRGRLSLRSADPLVPPLIEPNYLAEHYDVERLLDGVEILREVFAQAPFDRWRGAELTPGPDVIGRAALEAFVRRTADTVFHPVGTCRMGVDPHAVVDAALRVRGVDGLRVADASVFPTIPSTNTAAPTMMVGEKAAELIRSSGIAAGGPAA